MSKFKTKSVQRKFDYIFGIRSTTEVLKVNPDRIHKLFVTQNAYNKIGDELLQKINQDQIFIQTVKEIDKQVKENVTHQGCVAVVNPLDFSLIEDLDKYSRVIILDQITDPQNIGAIFRIAAAYKVDAIVTQERFSPIATGTLAKVASGGLEYVNWVRVVNISRALEKLKDNGHLILGFDSEATQSFANVKEEMKRNKLDKWTMIMGAEDKGVRQKIKSMCDYFLSIDVPGEIKSLNVSTATAIALDRLVNDL